VEYVKAAMGHGDLPLDAYSQVGDAISQAIGCLDQVSQCGVVLKGMKVRAALVCYSCFGTE